MRERSILFSAPMVKAILAGKKTQTRRVVKHQPQHGCIEDAPELGDGLIWWPRGKKHERYNNPCDANTLAHGMVVSPFAYARHGDRLWVRETHALRADVDGCENPSKAKQYTIYRADRADDDLGMERHRYERWRPSIFMPRWASRITLEVTGVRVERLHAINEEDARAEGCTGFDDLITLTPRGEFVELWKDINGAESWDANPWVWVVAFRRIEPGAKP